MYEIITKQKTFLQHVAIILFIIIIAFIFLTNSDVYIWKASSAVDIDQAVFKTVALMMERGYMPYRDSFDHKGPLLYIINFLGNQISSYRGVWFIEYIFMVIMLLCLYKIARLNCGKVLSCISMLMAVSLLNNFFELGNLVQEYAMAPISLSLFIFLDYFLNKKISRMRLILNGICFGCVLLLQPNMISVWIVFCIAILIQCIRNKSYQDLSMFLLFFILGAGIIIVPVIIWLAANDSLMDCWRAYIQFNLMYTSEMSSFAEKWESFFFYFDYLEIILSIAICVYLALKGTNKVYAIYLCYLLCTLYLIAISGLQFPHYAMILVPAVVFPISALFSICQKHISPKSSVNSPNVAILLVTLYFLANFIVPTLLPPLGSLISLYNTRNESDYPKLVEDVCYVIEENSTYDETISIYGSWDIIYVLSDRMHATKYSYIIPIGKIMPDIMDEYWEEMEEEPPKLIILPYSRCDDDMTNFLAQNNYTLIWSENKKESPTKIYKLTD